MSEIIRLSQCRVYRATSEKKKKDDLTYQGLAFLTKYRKLSSKDPESQEEVEYNHGRSFHGIGMPFHVNHMGKY
jgi:hypothetical protein